MTHSKTTPAAISTDIATLFVGHPHETLCIPEYQRSYTWGKKEVRRLIEDLTQYFSQGTQQHHYYLGSIIIHQEKSATATRLNIIDGQQRLTTMAILAYVLELPQQAAMTYASPRSQQQIMRNIDWLQKERDCYLTDLEARIKLEQINITVVITESEDDAYRFFETQNTGGVRLSGADIIKAHNLRAVPNALQDHYAKQWESLGDLTPLLDAIMKVRYWQALRFMPLPSHRRIQQVKTAVVKELADTCLRENVNVAYRTIEVRHSTMGELNLKQLNKGYAMRQPLNEGINTNTASSSRISH